MVSSVLGGGGGRRGRVVDVDLDGRGALRHGDLGRAQGVLAAVGADDGAIRFVGQLGVGPLDQRRAHLAHQVDRLARGDLAGKGQHGPVGVGLGGLVDERPVAGVALDGGHQGDHVEALRKAPVGERAPDQHRGARADRPGLKRVQRQPQKSRRQYGEGALALAYVVALAPRLTDSTWGEKRKLPLFTTWTAKVTLADWPGASVPIFNAAGA